MNARMRLRAEMRCRMRVAFRSVWTVLPMSLGVCFAAIAGFWFWPEAARWVGPVFLAVAAVVAGTGLCVFLRKPLVADVAAEIDRSLGLPDCALAAFELKTRGGMWEQAAGRAASAAFAGKNLPPEPALRRGALVASAAWTVILLAGIAGLPGMRSLPPDETQPPPPTAADLAAVEILAQQLQNARDPRNPDPYRAAALALAQLPEKPAQEDIFIAISRAEQALQAGSAALAASPGEGLITELEEALEDARDELSVSGLAPETAQQLADLARQLDQSGFKALAMPLGELAASRSAARAEEAFQALQSAIEASMAASAARSGMEQARLKVTATRDALGKSQSPGSDSSDDGESGRAGSGAGRGSQTASGAKTLNTENLVTADIQGTRTETGGALNFSLRGSPGEGRPSAPVRPLELVDGRLSGTVITAEELPLAYRGIVLRYFQALRNPEP